MIIIPMAGMSSRFFKAGFDKPKYMLTGFDKPLFDHAVESFKGYFQQEKFLFIIKDIYDTPEFVAQRCQHLGIKDFEIIVINSETRGQAETVALGLGQVNYNGAITIFNIDTFRPDFVFPKVINSDGYLEVFKGEGSNWSFAKPAAIDSDRVIETAEKNPISNLCSTGLYYFNDIKEYLEAYHFTLAKPESEWDKGELYVAPLYNYLIKKGLDIRYHLIERSDVIFCGVPDEYYDFIGSSQTSEQDD